MALSFDASGFQEMLLIFGSVYAYFKLRLGATLVVEEKKLVKAFGILLASLMLLVAGWSRELASFLFLGGALFYVLKKLFGLGFDGGLAMTLATALAWAVFVS